MRSKAVWLACRAHNPSVVGSNPTFANLTVFKPKMRKSKKSEYTLL